MRKGISREKRLPAGFTAETLARAQAAMQRIKEICLEEQKKTGIKKNKVRFYKGVDLI
jgi:hypothetical protein